MDVEARSSDAVRAPQFAVPGNRGGEKRVNPSPEGEEPAEAKKPKAESPSRKREAEGPPAAPEEEMVHGLPTIHDASLPTEAEEKEVKFYDERTGEALETSEVYKGRDKELTKMESFNVKNDITYAEAKAKGLRLVRSRWIDTAKEIDGKPGVRSRLVAQEVNTYKREDVSMGTPPMRVHRAIISHAATAKPGQK